MNATDRARRKVEVLDAFVRLVRSGAITANDAARRLRVDPETVRVWLAGGSLPSGRRVDDLARLVESLRESEK